MAKRLDSILYIDDEEANLLLFEEVFSKHFNVLTTISTKEAREILKKENIKVIVTDLKMPEESGLDFIKSVSPQYPDIIYIVLTAYADIHTVLKVVNQGNIYRYLLKPWDKNEVLFDLNNACHSYDLRAENLILLNELKNKNYVLEKTLSELQEREKQFFNIFNCSTDGIVIINKREQVLLANPAFYSFLGLTGQESLIISDFIKGKQLELFKERFIGLKDKILSVNEYEIFNHTGEKRIIEANSTQIDFFGEGVFLSVLRDITDRKLMSQRIFNAMLQAEEGERKRIASDLHDGLGPILSTLKMYIERLTDKTRQDNNQQIKDLSNKTIDEAINQLRTISYNLSPHILEKFGLLPAIQAQLEMVKSSKNINFILNSNLQERLKKEIEISLYRTLKECITNTSKYAGAQNIKLEILKGPDSLSVVFSDDGKGFDVKETISKSMGMGLYNIKNRIKSINGEIEINSAPGKGCQILINITDKF